ncbi:MAG: T9SS type A sorting domain-containing protein [Bacteroidetes bacterium]|nr:T9SS type A sorting domain-containing protein [Bacteroidota bacterium]
MKKLLLIISLFALTANAQYTKLFDFSTTDGYFPYGSLVSDGTYLYGVTFQGGTGNYGTVFKLKTDGTGYTVLHHFLGGTDGGNSRSSLIYDGAFLYGTTATTVFKLKTDGTNYSVLHNFTGSPDGSVSYSSLYNDGTYLYGTCVSGGSVTANPGGTVFKIKPDGTNYLTIHSFTANGVMLSTPSTPYAGVTSDGTYLYGTLFFGDQISGHMASIYKLMPDGSNFSTISCSNSTYTGVAPQGDLTYDGTYLYGTLTQGGAFNEGALFKVKPDGSGLTKLFDFNYNNNNNGLSPVGSLVIVGNYLYGLTYASTIYRIKPDGTGFMVLYNFSGSNGDTPYGSLISDGTYLYGMTNSGGTNNKGVIFKYNFTTVGSNELKPDNYRDKNFKIYPNPVTDVLRIESENQNITEGLEYKLFTIVGQVVVSAKVKEHNMPTINLKELPTGIYFIRFNYKGQLVTKKIIKE